MKKLDRSLADVPHCLDKFISPQQTWDNVKAKHKKQIWDSIYQVQGYFCAYCESPAYRGESTGHIEHFFHKGSSMYRHLTFQWGNLFGCCASKSHCGHFKDQQLGKDKFREYDPAKLLKPDLDDPEEYLQFLPSGNVQVKDGLEPQRVERAEETIKALNLQVSTLISSRHAKIDMYQKRLEALDELAAELSDDEYDGEYLSIQDESQTVAHRTAIKQAVF